MYGLSSIYECYVRLPCSLDVAHVDYDAYLLDGNYYKQAYQQSPPDEFL